MDRKRGEHSQLAMKSDPNSLAQDLAATRIQAGFRGYRFRKEHPELTHTLTKTHVTHTSASQSLSVPIRSSRATEPHELTPSTAATRIQAGFRGYQTRKHLHDDHKPLASHPSGNTSSHHSMKPDLAAAKIQAGFRGYRTRKDLRNQQHQPHVTYRSDPTDIHSDPNYAATRIQATFRGYQTRRALHGSHQPSGHDSRTPLRTQNPNPRQTVWDSPDSKQFHSGGQDPDQVNKAATIIQAGFRGYQTRKHLHPITATTTTTTTTITTPTDTTTKTVTTRRVSETYGTDYVNKENAEQAATRIQAAYRGFATRKHLHESDPICPKQSSDRTTSRTTTTSSTRTTTHYSDPSEAATKIQATFRGYRTRQHVHLPHSTTSNASPKETFHGSRQI